VSILQNSSLENPLSFLVDNVSIVVGQESHFIYLLAIIIKEHILLVLGSFENRLAKGIHLKLPCHFFLVEFSEAEDLRDLTVLEKSFDVKYLVVFGVHNVSIHVD
jgi:hypothetical protein